jgi:CDP-glycerol glycerophosphotransferase
LVTDYSSAIFDLAITGKPIIFFAYDFEEYRDSTRGLYFDLDDDAPGPTARTAEELEALLLGTASTSAASDAYRSFRHRFCHLEDGHAADHVLRSLSELMGMPSPTGRASRAARQSVA